LKSDEVIAFITPPAEDIEAETIPASAVSLADDIRNTFSSRYKGFHVSIGLGRFYAEPENLSRTFDEARTALKIGRVLGRQDAITCFDDVGAYKLLLRAYEQSPEDLRALYEETVKPLTDYDEKHGSELTKTLERYLANDKNLNKTSEELIAHRHTIKYRLNRIAEITGLSVDSTENVERLGLGLKAARLLDGLNRA
jgi:sugar diacid utilization regulator